MRASTPAAIVMALAACSACRTPGTSLPKAEPLAAVARDVHSYARPEEARVTHVGLDLRVDFAAKRLSGQATLKLQRAPGSSHVVLDTRRLSLRGVADKEGRALTYTLGDGNTILGQPLDVTLPAGVEEIVVSYDTMPEADALQWLSPAQTAGKKHPYLFSQGQAILTRTWIPTQDSPGIRQTYSARIVVPRGSQGGHERGAADAGWRRHAQRAGRFEFRLTQPIPPYLFALAVGDLAVPIARPAHRRLRRTGGRRVRRRRIPGRGEDGCGRGIAARAVPLGTLRRPRAAAVVPVRGHGESAADVRHADGPGRRSVAGVADRARARAFVVRQPGHQRHLERLLAERRGDQLRRAPHHGSALRARARRDARKCWPGRSCSTRSRGSADRRPRRRSCTSTSTAAIRTRAPPASPTTRARR